MRDLELDWRFIHQQRGNYIYLINIILTFDITTTRVMYQMVFFPVIFVEPLSRVRPRNGILGLGLGLVVPHRSEFIGEL